MTWPRALHSQSFASLAFFLAVLVPGTQTEPETPDNTPPAAIAVSHALSKAELEVLQAAARAFRIGDYAGCLRTLETADGVLPHPEILNLRGAALSELGRRKEANAMFEWALEADPSHFWARFNLAESALMDGDLAMARTRFLAMNPADPVQSELIALKLTLIAHSGGDLSAARRNLPPWPPVSAAGYAAYAVVAHAEGNDPKFHALLSEARQKHPDQWDNFLVKTLKESGLPIR